MQEETKVQRRNQSASVLWSNVRNTCSEEQLYSHQPYEPSKPNEPNKPNKPNKPLGCSFDNFPGNIVR